MLSNFILRSNKMLRPWLIGGFAILMVGVLLSASIAPVNAQTTQPRVVDSNPPNGATNIPLGVGFGIGFELFLPNSGVDPNTLLEENVYIYESSDVNKTPIASQYSTSGGQDTITVVPSVELDANTNYTVQVTSGVTDSSGVGFIPHTMSFTTGSQSSGDPIPGVEFQKISPVPGAPKGLGYTSLEFGPDGRLYAAAFAGVYHWEVEADGTLTKQEFIPVGPAPGSGSRFVVGIAFDPASTPTNPIMWISHNDGDSLIGGFDGPRFSGRIGRLTVSGHRTASESWTLTDYIVGLPRSTRDHLTNSIEFGPDDNLYFNQGSLSAMGDLDSAWKREEVMLAAATLQIDMTKLNDYFNVNGPLNVQTGTFANPNDNTLTANYDLGSPQVINWPNPGSFYNPQHPDAPVTIFGSGVRNAYDLLWHSNGQLYVPTNGSAGNGVAPASNTARSSCKSRVDNDLFGDYNGPSVPQAFPNTQRDYMFRVEEGRYYGHPNPTRCEWVINGGDPTSGTDPADYNNDYPVGTLPDRNWAGFTYDFDQNISPNGVIEYQSNTFSGALQGKIVVTRYNTGFDLIFLEPDSAPPHDIIDASTGIPGTFGLVDPLDVVEDVTNGNLYVIEYYERNPGENKITLMRPVNADQPDIAAGPQLYLNQVVANGPSAPQDITVINNGSGPLNISNISTSGEFAIANLPSVDTTLGIGESTIVEVTFDPSFIGVQVGNLTILSDDPTDPAFVVPLRGLGTAGEGGNDEPSLQTVIDTYGFPVDVGDDFVGTTTINSATPTAPLLGDEVPLQIFEKAGAGSVTIEPIAVFAPDDNPVLELGWYQPGNPGAKNSLFTVETGSDQTLNPVTSGALSFDPGIAPFSFYSTWPFFSNRTIYGQDDVNTFTNAIPHHVRVYPLQDQMGIVENAYIVAVEETTSGFDYQDVVFIVRNVQPVSLSQGLIVSEPERLIFSSVRSRGSDSNRVLTLQNVGVAEVNIANLSISGPFSIVGTSGTTIPVGGTVDVTISFNATTNGPHFGNLSIDSDAVEPTTVFTVAGLSIASPGGGNEPSLQWIFDTYGFQVATGDENPDTTPIHKVASVASSPIVGDEIRAQNFVRANPGSVTVEPLGGYAIDGSPVVNMGWHPAGDYNTLNQVFSVNNGSDQTLNQAINGSLSFDPGNAPFGMYAEWVPIPWNGRLTFQEDGGNADFFQAPDSTSGGLYSIPHHVRVFPLVNADGVVEDNAYILAYEEWTQGYDYNDIVVIVRNVIPVQEDSDPIGLVVENLDWQSSNEIGYGLDWFNERIVFQNMGIKTTSSFTEGGVQLDHKRHNQVTLRLHNTWTQPITINDIALTNNQYLGRLSGPAYILPNGETIITIQPSDHYDLLVEYVAEFEQTVEGDRSGAYEDTMTLSSNAPNAPELELTLMGGYMERPQGIYEVDIYEIMDLFGITTALVDDEREFSTNYVASGEEILSHYWEVLDPSKPVYMRQLAALHGCCSEGSREQIQIMEADDRSQIDIFYHDNYWGQALLPSADSVDSYDETNGTPRPGDLAFHSPAVFYFRPDNRDGDAGFTGADGGYHALRIWPVRNPEGRIVEGVYVLGQDYIPSGGCQETQEQAGLCDFNDNLYLVTNIEPAQGYAGLTFDTDVMVGVTAAQEEILLSENMVFDVEVSNDSPITANDVQLDMTLPTGINVVSITTDIGTCGAPAGSAVNCNIGTLPAGQFATVTVELEPTGPGDRTLTLTASTTSTDADSLNDSDFATITVLNFNSTPGTLNIVKEAQPQSEQAFDFTGDLGEFTLIDNGQPGNDPIASINFQPDLTPLAGYDIVDNGAPYGTYGDYGWRELANDDPIDANSVTRARGGTSDEETLIHMQFPGFPEIYWEYVIPNGTYNVTVGVGDADTSNTDSTHVVNVEGIPAFNPPLGAGTAGTFETTVTVEVTDGVLTIDPIGGTNTKLVYVQITGGAQNIETFQLEEGAYLITEDLPPFWQLDDIICVGGADPFSIVGNGVEVNVNSEENITCTFTNTEVNGPAVNITKTADVRESQPGVDVTFTITVTNIGEEPLNDVVVADEVTPDCALELGSIPMDDGTTEDHIVSYTCEALNVETTLTNVANVTGVPATSGGTVEDSSTATVTIVTPGIDIQKTPDIQNGVQVGDDVNFTIRVENTGNVTLANVIVSDVAAPACGATLGSMEPGAVETYACTAQDVTETFTNIATVQGEWVSGGVTYTDEDSALVVLDGLAYETPIYRVNAGGPLLPAIDGGPSWVANSGQGAQTFFNTNGTNTGQVNTGAISTGTAVGFDGSVDTIRVPAELFNNARFDRPEAPEMEWDFNVDPGEYEVRLYFANLFGGTSDPGERVFTVLVEGSSTTITGEELVNYDIALDVGHQTGVMKVFRVDIPVDGNLDIDFIHTPADNPLINAIEILPITRPTPAILGANPTSLDFGNVPINSVPGELTVDLEHLGVLESADINITNIAITGANADQFSVAPNGTLAPPITLSPAGSTAPGAVDSTTLTVSFVPTSLDAKYAAIEVTHDGDNGSPVIIPIKGLGTPLPAPNVLFGEIGAPIQTLEFSLEQGDNTANEQIGIFTSSGSVSYVIDNSNAPNWLTNLTPLNGSINDLTAQPFTVAVDATGLPLGTYTYTAEATAPEYEAGTLEIILNVTPPQYTVTTDVGANGAISPVGPLTINEGDDVNFTITPDLGYGIDFVTVNGQDVTLLVAPDGSFTLSNVREDKDVVVRFILAPTYTVTSSVSTVGGTITPLGEQIVNEGDDITFTITPDAGYNISNVLVDGAPQGPIGTYTFNNVMQNHTISASFTQTCSPYSTESCETIPVSTVTDICLDFDGLGRGLVDQNGVGTGFTMVDPPSLNQFPVTPSFPAVPGYEPSNLLVDGGELTIAATQGIQFEDNNTQVNALGLGFDATEAFTLRTTLTNFDANGPANSFAQGGIWFGLDEDQYVKVVVRRDSIVQMAVETGPNTSDEINTATQAGILLDEVELILELDPVAENATASFSRNGGAPVAIGTLPVPASFFTGQTLPTGMDLISFGGVFGTTRNFAGDINFSFADFCLEPANAIPNTDPLVSVNETLVVEEGSSATIDPLVLDVSDAEQFDSQLVFNVTTPPANGTLNKTIFTQLDLNNGTVFYTHDATETTDDSFEFTVTDGAGGTVSDTFLISITPVDDPPVLVANEILTLNEGATATITPTELEYSDQDTAIADLTYTLINEPINGTLELNGTALVANDTFTQSDIVANILAYRHDGSETTSDIFGFSLTDGTTVLSDAFQIQINVIDDAPVLVNNVPLTVAEGNSRTITSDNLLYEDEEQGPSQIVYELNSLPVNGTLTISGTAATIGATFTQSDIASAALVYAHDGTETSTDSFNYVVSDGTTALPTATFDITISGVNNPPTLNNSNPLTVDEGGTGNITQTMLEYVDVEQFPASIEYTITTPPANGTVRLNGVDLNVGDTFTQANINDNRVAYRHDGSETTDDSFGYEVTDGVDASSGFEPTEPIPGTFEINVTPVNDPPVAQNNEDLFAVTGEQTTVQSTNLTYADPDNGPEDVAYTITVAPVNGTLRNTVTGLTNTFTQSDINMGYVVYTHDGSNTTDDSFSFSVTDGDATTTPLDGTLNIIIGTNTAPQAVDDMATTPANTPVLIQVTGNDIDAEGNIDFTSVTIVSEPGSGSAVPDSAGRVLYTPDAGFQGMDTFTYTVRDTVGAISNEATVMVTVGTGNNMPMVTTNNGLTIAPGSSAVISNAVLETSDQDDTPENLIYTVVTATTEGLVRVNGSVVVAGGQFTQADINAGIVTYQSTSSQNDSFVFTVTDGQTTTVETIFNITIDVPISNIPTNLWVSGNLNTYPLTLIYNWTHRISEDATTVPADWYRIIVTRNGQEIINEWASAEEACVGVVCSLTYLDKTPPYLFDNGEYTWRVEAWTALDSSGQNWDIVSSEDATFIINVSDTQPAQGVIVEPNQGRSTISWDDDPGITWFQIYLGNDQGTIFLDWIPKTFDICDGVRCSFTPNVNPRGGTYDYWIRTYGPTGISPGGIDGWQGPYSVTLPSTPPDMPTGLTQTDENLGRPTFSWDGVERATWYHLWIGEVVGSNNWKTVHAQWYLAEALDCENAEACELPLQVDLPNGTYDWALQAWGPGGLSSGPVAGAWSDLQRFNIAAPAAGVATLVSPVGQATESVSTMTWEVVEGAVWYQLWLGDGNGNSIYTDWFYAGDMGCLPGSAATTCTADFGTVLPAGSYTWTVQAYTPASTGEWSPTASFTAP